MPVRTFCIRPPQRSAKTTRLYVLKICRYAICLSQQQERANNREKWCDRNPALTGAFWIKGGDYFVNNWTTSCSGMEGCCLLCLRKTRVEPVHVAYMFLKIIVRHKPCSSVSIVNIRI